MKIRLHHLLYAGVAVAAVFLIMSRFGSEERRVAARLDALAQLVSKDGEESALALAERGRQLAALFSDDFLIALEPYGAEIRDRASLTRQLAAYRQGTERIEATLADVEIALGRGERTAQVAADAVLSARWSDGRPSGRERYRLRFELAKISGDWKIERLTLVEVIEGPERFF